MLYPGLQVAQSRFCFDMLWGSSQGIFLYLEPPGYFHAPMLRLLPEHHPGQAAWKAANCCSESCGLTTSETLTWESCPKTPRTLGLAPDAWSSCFIFPHMHPASGKGLLCVSVCVAPKRSLSCNNLPGSVTSETVGHGGTRS